MSARRRRLGLVGAIALVAACGGPSFTVVAPDGGEGDGTTEGAPGGDAGGTADASRDVGVPTDGSPDVRYSDAPGSDADAVADTGPQDAFVLDVLQPPPPHCNGAFGCVPAVPAGWSGPYELYAASGSSPACGSEFAGPAYDGNNGLTAPLPSCRCSCAAATGVACSAPTASFYGEIITGTSCSASNHCTDVSLAPGACKDVSILSTCPALSASAAAMTFPASAPSGGSCAPVPGSSVASPAWSTHARACISAVTPAQVDCPAGAVCVASPASPFAAGVCISQPGVVPCPSTGYTSGQTFYGGVDDTRACTACSCASVSGATCSATITVSSSANGTCSGGGITYNAPVSCAAVQQPGDFRLSVTPSGGSCTASSVSATGAATPTLPTTFCCLP